RLAAYRDKLSRALLDRFDLLVTVPRPRAVKLAAAPSEASELARERVVAARERLRAQRISRTDGAEALLSRAVERLPLSARGRVRPTAPRLPACSAASSRRPAWSSSAASREGSTARRTAAHSRRRA